MSVRFEHSCCTTPLPNISSWRKKKTTNRWGLSAKVNRKSRDNSAAHFPIAANARTDEFYEWFWRFFQHVESNYSGRLSRVSSQPVMIPKGLPLDAWYQSGLQENAFQFSTFDSPKDYSQRIESDEAQRNRGAVPEAIDCEFYNTGGITAEPHGRTANVGIAIRRIP